MDTIKRLWKVVLSPRVAAQDIVEVENIRSSLGLVLGFGIVLSALFLISYLKADYPPPPGDLETWIEAWGEFSILPFVKVPVEKYRLAQAIFITPLVMAVWILMAGSARILSTLFRGKVSFEQYLNLYGYSFFVFWIIGSALDTVYSGILGEFVLKALRMEYGILVRTITIYFAPIMWVSVLSLGGIYNAIVTHESERYSLGKSVLVGMVTFVWPIISISYLIR
jgi:hypothetical protein